jgi:hypothetical protein
MKETIEDTGQGGNQAREALIQYFDEYEFEDTGMYKPDHLLAWLWVEGFKVVRI